MDGLDLESGCKSVACEKEGKIVFFLEGFMGSIMSAECVFGGNGYGDSKWLVE